jgi:predicted metalloprotease with PDZ domain
MEERLDPTDASITRSGFVGILNYSIFGWVDGREQEPVQCTVTTFDQWPIFSSNQPTTSMAKGSFTFKTDNYYTLADGQIFLGPKFRLKEYKGIVPLFIASYCESNDEYLDDYGKQGVMSMEMLNNYFGEIPFKEYSILLRKALPLSGVGSMPFGMEHLQSSTFFGDTAGLRRNAMNEEEIIEGLDSYLHHMGHAFIPLRSYGDAYRPFVKELPPIINNIWFNEGFMWFVPYELLQSKELKQWFDDNTNKADPIIKEMNLQLLSQEASVMYTTDFRLGQAVVARGALMAIEMDNYLKETSGGKKSMKDVIRYLYYWSKDNKRSFTMEEFPALINKASGFDLSNIYIKWQLPMK